MDTQKFIVGLVVGIFLAGGIWYFIQAPADMRAVPAKQDTPMVAPPGVPAYGPTTPPSVTPPTSPPPAY